MTVLGKGVKHRRNGFGNMSTTGQIGFELGGLCGCRQLLVEQEVNDVFGRMVGKFGNGVATVVDALGRGYERGSAGPNRHATEPGVEVGLVDGEHRFILRHDSSLVSPDIHVLYKCGSCSSPRQKTVLLATLEQSVVFNGASWAARF